MFSGLPKQPKSQEFYALLAMLAATAIWGFAPPIIKYTLDFIPVYSFLFYRFLIVCLVLFPFVYMELRRQNVSLKEFPALAISGLTGQTSLVILFLGLKYTSSLEVAVIGVIAPLLMVVAGHYFFNERVNKKIQVGLVITSLGTLVLAIGPLLDSNSVSSTTGSRIWGNILIIIYNLFWVVHVLWSKRIRGENSHAIDQTAKFFGIPIPRKKYSSQLVTGVSFYIGLVSMIPLYILESSGRLGVVNFNIINLNLNGWIGLLYMALLSSIVAYGLFEWSLKYLKVTDTVIFSYISPIFTLPAAFFILGELPTKGIILGSIVIALGILVAERKKG
ncbi:MAG: DMT family transporter [Patescibacteria group bacterium]